MLGPYTANKDGTISYKGNKVFKPVKNINSIGVPIKEIENRVEHFNTDKMWEHIAKINHQINMSANLYFEEIGSIFTALPLTTRMISSPGAVYGKEAINYTTDTCPITIKWFELPNEAFLSESSQIYLELALMQKGINSVYSIYNSFRKEKADATHLSEFHHIEYEGKVNQIKNEEIALGLIKRIILDLLKKNKRDLEYFLSNKILKELEEFAENIMNIPKITFGRHLIYFTKKQVTKSIKSLRLSILDRGKRSK